MTTINYFLSLGLNDKVKRKRNKNKSGKFKTVFSELYYDNKRNAFGQ